MIQLPLPTKQPWKQEVIWVQRNSEDVIIGMSEKLPDTNNFVPSMHSGDIAVRNNDFARKDESVGK